MGRYEEAAPVLRRVEADAPDVASREEAAFQQAEIFFYSGQTDTAEAAYQRVVSSFSGGNRVNDALDRILASPVPRKRGPCRSPLWARSPIRSESARRPRARDLSDGAKSAVGCAAEEDILREETLLLIDLGRLDEAGATADTVAARFKMAGRRSSSARSPTRCGLGTATPIGSCAATRI